MFLLKWVLIIENEWGRLQIEKRKNAFEVRSRGNKYSNHPGLRNPDLSRNGVLLLIESFGYQRGRYYINSNPMVSPPLCA